MPVDNSEEVKEVVPILMAPMVLMAPQPTAPRVPQHKQALQKGATLLRTLTPMTPAMTCRKASILHSHN